MSNDLCCDQGLQGNAVGYQQSRTALLDKMLLLEAREQPADSFSRGANHLSDLFVSQSQLHLAGVSGCSVLIEPSHQQSSEFFAGGVRKDQITDFAAGGSIVLADVLRHPQRQLAVKAHEPQQIAVPQKADLAGLLDLSRSFIRAFGNYRSDS